MATERLYFDDAYLTHFQARVVERLTWHGRPAVVLDRTAFYPEGGGQPADHGTLNGVPVVDVQVRPEDRAVVHVLAAPLDADDVEGRVDWPRRFDHMQQHTAQHILSQAFLRVAEAETVGFHLGREVVTIDLDRHDLSEEDLQRAEDLANRVVDENRPVTARFVDDATLARLNVRRPVRVTGPVRIVEVADFDRVPCGGTHVRATAEVGLIAILRAERYKGGTRVTFVAGQRARRDYRQRRLLLTQVGRLLSCGETDLIARVERLLADHQRLSRLWRQAQERLLAQEAATLWAKAPTVGLARLVTHVITDAEPDAVRRLAGMLREQGTVVALLGWQGPEQGRVVFTASPDLPLHLGHMLRDVLSTFGGRGGGRPEWAEGALPDPQSVPLALAEAARRVEKVLGQGD